MIKEGKKKDRWTDPDANRWEFINSEPLNGTG